MFDIVPAVSLSSCIGSSFAYFPTHVNVQIFPLAHESEQGTYITKKTAKDIFGSYRQVYHIDIPQAQC